MRRSGRPSEARHSDIPGRGFPLAEHYEGIRDPPVVFPCHAFRRSCWWPGFVFGGKWEHAAFGQSRRQHAAVMASSWQVDPDPDKALCDMPTWPGTSSRLAYGNSRRSGVFRMHAELAAKEVRLLVGMLMAF